MRNPNLYQQMNQLSCTMSSWRAMCGFAGLHVAGNGNNSRQLYTGAKLSEADRDRLRVVRILS
jgi:hypothetical protein